MSDTEPTDAAAEPDDTAPAAEPDDTTPVPPVEPPLSAEERVKKSNRQIRYVCTNCQRVVGRDNLKVKRVQFKEMGENGPIIQSRTVAWLCTIAAPGGGLSCLEKDEAWKMEALASAPGLADTKLGKS